MVKIKNKLFKTPELLKPKKQYYFHLTVTGIDGLDPKLASEDTKLMICWQRGKKTGSSEVFSLRPSKESIDLDFTFKTSCQFSKTNGWNEVEQKKGGFKNKTFTLMIKDCSEKDKSGFGRSEKGLNERIIWKIELNMIEYVLTKDLHECTKQFKLDKCLWQHRDAVLNCFFKSFPKKLIGDSNADVDQPKLGLFDQEKKLFNFSVTIESIEGINPLNGDKRYSIGWQRGDKKGRTPIVEARVKSRIINFNSTINSYGKFDMEGSGYKKKVITLTLQDHTGLSDTVEPKKDWSVNLNMADYLKEGEIYNEKLEIKMIHCNFAQIHTNAFIKLTIQTKPTDLPQKESEHQIVSKNLKKYIFEVTIKEITGLNKYALGEDKTIVFGWERGARNGKADPISLPPIGYTKSFNIGCGISTFGKFEPANENGEYPKKSFYIVLKYGHIIHAKETRFELNMADFVDCKDQELELPLDRFDENHKGAKLHISVSCFQSKEENKDEKISNLKRLSDPDIDVQPEIKKKEEIPSNVTLKEINKSHMIHFIERPDRENEVKKPIERKESMLRAEAKLLGKTPDGFPYYKLGYMTKRGGLFHSWKKRFFVLTEGALYYYESEKDYLAQKKELGFVDLTLAAVKDDFIDKKHCMSISNDKKTLYVQTEDSLDWKKQIEAVVQLQFLK